MGMSLLSILKTISARGVSTVPSTFPSSASDGAAKAIGTTAAIKRVDMRFMSLHLFPAGGIFANPTHRDEEQLSYRENISHRRSPIHADLSESENVLVTNYWVLSYWVSPGLRSLILEHSSSSSVSVGQQHRPT